MLRDAPIRTKLIAIFILPALGAATLAALRVTADFRDGLQADRERKVVALATTATTLAHELAAERDSSAAWIAAGRPASGRSDVHAARVRADRAVAAFGALTRSGADLARDDPRLRAALAAAAQDLGRLAAERQAADRRAGADDTLSSYSETTGELLGVAARLPAGVARRELARDLDSFAALAQAEEAASFVRGLGTTVALGGRLEAPDDQRLAGAIGERRRELARFQATATPEQLRRYADSVNAPRVERADELEALMLAGSRARTLDVGADDWSVTMTERVDALRTVARRLAEALLASNRASIAAAERRLLVDLLLLGIVLVLTVALAGFLARSMIRPLQLLEAAARDVAERKLPGVVERLRRAERVDLEEEAAPLEVGTRDEVGRVAEAFTAVQRVAVRVAIDQAALQQSVSEAFVNMARRSQSLVDRQLSLLDELERGETDPDQLGQLFRLDHLATRMRRNAESLIVLSGSEPGHRWSQPVPLSGLVRAAVAEVEDYTRVQLLPMEDVRLAGPAGIDVVHLLAELIENATAFSPPETSVVMAGESVSSGYLIEIEDCGIGMSDAELEAANERLANPPLEDFTVSRMLGFFVIGRLAQRHGIKVQLRHSQYGGVTALVLLPPGVIVGAADGTAWPPAGAQRPASRPVRAALKPLPGRVGSRVGAPLGRIIAEAAPTGAPGRLASAYVPLRRHNLPPRPNADADADADAGGGGERAARVGEQEPTGPSGER